MKPGLQKVRKLRGFSSAREFAESIGWSVGTYTNYEQGTRDMTLKVAWELADLLECSIDEIAGREWHTIGTIDNPLASDSKELMEAYGKLDHTSRLAVKQLADTLSPETASDTREGVA